MRFSWNSAATFFHRRCRRVLGARGHGEDAAEVLEDHAPQVALVLDEALQHRERDRLGLARRDVFHRAQDGGDVREGRDVG
jgi:hypothetical protein